MDGVITRYLYSNEGLIAEYDINNNLKKSYGWMPNGIWGTDPLYMTENNQTYYYHNDGLGTPQKMTDANGTVVWSATYTAFGEATVDPSSTITNNLRFAGQYFDSETGLHYNLFRVYDPKTGKYISKDPIGFTAGDTNLYRYVFNNPVNLTDPEGLFGIFGPGLKNVRWPHESCRDENDPEDPYIKSLMTPYLKGDKVPGQFGTLGLVLVYGIGSAVYREGIWVVRAKTYGTPLPITVDPNLYIMTPEKAEYYKPQKKKK